MYIQLMTGHENWYLKFSGKGQFICSSKTFTEKELLGKWQLLSFTLNLLKKESAIYIDGENMTAKQQVNNTTPVYPGWIDLMNWLPNREHDIRNTPGQVDFLSIHRKAFTPEEIKEFYENSRHN